jgi:hypothetical protein
VASNGRIGSSPIRGTDFQLFAKAHLGEPLSFFKNLQTICKHVTNGKTVLDSGKELSFKIT